MEVRAKPILVAVDGSQPSNWALGAAARLADRLHAAVVVLHVVVPPNLGASEIALNTEDLIEQLRQEGDGVLQAACQRLPAALAARAVLREGYPAQQIVVQAREMGADLIVMGSRGRGRWTHFILGSIAEAVIREAPCPVVAVSHDPGPDWIVPAEAVSGQQQPAGTA